MYGNALSRALRRSVSSQVAFFPEFFRKVRGDISGPGFKINSKTMTGFQRERMDVSAPQETIRPIRLCATYVFEVHLQDIKILN